MQLQRPNLHLSLTARKLCWNYFVLVVVVDLFQRVQLLVKELLVVVPQTVPVQVAQRVLVLALALVLMTNP